MNGKQQKGRQVPCEHFNILKSMDKNPYLCTDGASLKKHAYKQTNKKKLK